MKAVNERRHLHMGCGEPLGRLSQQVWFVTREARAASGTRGERLAEGLPNEIEDIAGTDGSSSNADPGRRK